MGTSWNVTGAPRPLALSTHPYGRKAATEFRVASWEPWKEGLRHESRELRPRWHHWFFHLLVFLVDYFVHYCDLGPALVP